jgi:hypothetical protein
VVQSDDVTSWWLAIATKDYEIRGFQQRASSVK